MLKSPVRLILACVFILCGCAAAEPDTAKIQSVLNEAHQRFSSVTEGKNADYIPYLAGVDSKLFGLAVVTVEGEVLAAGDSDYQFAIESISKVFTALILADKSDVHRTRVRNLEPAAFDEHDQMN